MTPTTTIPNTDSALIVAVRSGSKDAFRQLYGRFAPVLYGYIAQLVADTKTAEEILQQSFIAIWNSRRTIDRQPLISWLIDIARITIKKYVPDNHNIKNQNPASFVYNINIKDPSYAAQLQQAVFYDVYVHGFNLNQLEEKWNIEKDKLKIMLRSAMKNHKTNNL
jgi:hypothetical protein